MAHSYDRLGNVMLIVDPTCRTSMLVLLPGRLIEFTIPILMATLQMGYTVEPDYKNILQTVN
jgi:hypothetical protein